MNLYVGAINHGQAVDRALSGQGLEDFQPQTLATPSIEAIVDRGVGPLARRAVAACARCR
jgi:hypothetical protein